MEQFGFLALDHYTMGAMILFTLVALIISIVYYRRHRDLRILTWYIASSLISDISSVYAFPDRDPDHFRAFQMYLINFAFVLFEFIACNLFILRSIRSPQRRRVIKVNALLFFGCMTVDAAITFPNYKQISNLFVIYYYMPECFFLVIPCLVYFYDLFLTKNLRPLTDQPAFWVITGILFLNACDLPLLLTNEIMKTNHHFTEAFTLNNILYITLFVLLIRAFLCPPPNSRSLTQGNPTPVSG